MYYVVEPFTKVFLPNLDFLPPSNPLNAIENVTAK